MRSFSHDDNVDVDENGHDAVGENENNDDEDDDEAN